MAKAKKPASDGVATPDTANPSGVVVRFIRRDAPFEVGAVYVCPAVEAEKHIRHGVAVAEGD